jgi:hypothetical protein
MNSIYRYLTQPVNLNRFSWPISGYPSPAIKPEAPLVPADIPPTPAQVEAKSDGDLRLPAGESIIALANSTSPPGLSTPGLIIIAILLAFVLGFLSRTLLISPEDSTNFSSDYNADVHAEWSGFRKLLHVPFFGRYIILGIANAARQ